MSSSFCVSNALCSLCKSSKDRSSEEILGGISSKGGSPRFSLNTTNSAFVFSMYSTTCSILCSRDSILSSICSNCSSEDNSDFSPLPSFRPSFNSPPNSTEEDTDSRGSGPESISSVDINNIDESFIKSFLILLLEKNLLVHPRGFEPLIFDFGGRYFTMAVVRRRTKNLLTLDAWWQQYKFPLPPVEGSNPPLVLRYPF